MMAFRRPVASQEAAARYLTELAGHWAGPIMVGGHFQGGNLAVYAAAKCLARFRNVSRSYIRTMGLDSMRRSSMRTGTYALRRRFINRSTGLVDHRHAVFETH